jgi:hypothetical protein
MSRDRRLLIGHLEQIRCIDEADGWGKAEPYLWTIFIAMGGEQLRQDPDDPFRLLGEPHYSFGQGSHGNLGRAGFDEGDRRAIPPAVGAFGTMIRPIELNVLGNSIKVPAVSALIAVLMEEDNVSDSGAEAGHQALNQLVTQRVNEFLAGLNLFDVYIDANDLVQAAGTDMTIEEAAVEVLKDRFTALQEALVNDANSVIADAIQNSQGLFANLWSWVNADDFVDAHMFLTTTEELLADDREIALAHRFNEGDGDYEITGKFTLSKPFIPIGEIPNVNRLEVSGIAKRHSRRYKVDYITHVGGIHEGEPWILHKYNAAVMERDGLRQFFTRAPDGSETEIHAAQHEDTGSLYIRTHSNETTEDNLLSLPALSFYYEDE